METLIEIILEYSYQRGKTKMDQLYAQFKPAFIKEINRVMDLRIIYKTKKRTKVENFANAFYGMLDAGGKCKNIKSTYGLSPGSYQRYLKICDQSHLIEDLHFNLIRTFKEFITSDTTTDTFTVRAKGALEAKGYHHKEKNKLGTGVSIIADLQLIPLSTYTDAGNINDREMLWMTLGDPEVPICKINRIFADKGYTGQQFKDILFDDHKVKLICPPKKNSKNATKNVTKKNTKKVSKKVSKNAHAVTEEDIQDLNIHRNKIEHVNLIFRNFRSIDVRYTKTINTYKCFISMATLLTAVMKLKDVLAKSNNSYP